MTDAHYGSEDFDNSIDDANELLDGSIGEDETTSDDPHLTASREESDRKARLYKKARETRDRLNRLMSDLGEKADETQRKVRENAEVKIKEGLDQTETKIKDHPFAAVGVAAGVGLLLGLLINRSR